MIDMAHNDSLIDDVECNMLHNLRMSRNALLHNRAEKRFYTPEIVKEWIELVFRIR